MLVISRRLHEAVLIGPDIRITIVRISGGQVKLGIEANKDIPISREEPDTKENPQ